MPNKPKRFTATLERSTEGLGWTIARLGFDPHTVWNEMLRLRVRGELTGAGGPVGFRSSLFPMPGESGEYLLLVNNHLQGRAGVGVGSVVELVLEPDLEPRPAELPEELAALLDEEPEVREFYASLSESMRREIGKWVLGVKSEAARRHRAEQMAERLMGAMEGERELPPVVAAAFRRRPKAKVGWGKMTQTQRRQHLLGVFYYQTPEARGRRVEKLCDEAEKKA